MKAVHGVVISVLYANSQSAVIILSAAAQVLSKGQHVLHNMELAVRKPLPKDQHRLLLQGINPETGIDLIELYVENMIGLNATDYTLNPTLGSGFILIQFSQPISKGTLKLTSFVSKSCQCFQNISKFFCCIFIMYLFFVSFCRFPESQC